MKRMLSKQHAALFTKIFTLTFVMLMGYAIIAQTILIPRAIANSYNEQLNPDFKKLRQQFNALSKSTELSVYNDPYSDVQTARRDLIATQKLIAETELTLTNYEQRADRLQNSRFAPLSLNFKKAEVTRSRSEDIFLQSREVIGNYKELTNYLLQINNAQIVFKNSTFEINGLTDLNVLKGQGDIVTKRADQLRGAIATAQKLTPPADLTTFHVSIIDTFQLTLTGLDQLSRGLFAVDDNQINAAAAVLEQAIRKYESNDSLAFDTASATSPVLAETAMLADKIDSLKPFSEQ